MHLVESVLLFLGRVVNMSLNPKSYAHNHHNHDYRDNDHDDDDDDSSHLLRELCAVRKDCESFEASALAPPEHHHHHNCQSMDDNDAQDDDGDEDARPELRSTWLKCQRQ